MSSLFGLGPPRSGQPSNSLGSLVTLRDGASGLTPASPKTAAAGFDAQQANKMAMASSSFASQGGYGSSGGAGPHGGDSSEAPMTYQDMQELVRAERLWWSEASERQVKRLDVSVEAKVSEATERFTTLGKQMEERLSQRIGEERQERQAAHSVMRRDFDAQQVLIERLDRQGGGGGMQGDMFQASGKLKDELFSALDFVRTDLETSREEYRGALQLIASQREQARIQVQEVEAAVTYLRRQTAEQIGHESKFKDLEATIAGMRTDHSELRERHQHNSSAMREATDSRVAGVDASITDLRGEVLKIREAQSQSHSQQRGTLAEEDLKLQLEELQAKLVRSIEQTNVALRQEMESVRVEQHTSLSQDIQERCARLTSALDAERTFRESESRDIRANLEVSCEKTARALAMPSTVIEEKCQALSSALESERRERRDDASDFRKASAKMENRLGELQRAVDGERDATAQKAVEVRSKCDSLGLKMDAELEGVKVMIARELRELSARTEELREHQGTNSLKDTSAHEGKALDAAMIDSALGRERAALAARGDLPSQLRAELVARIESVDSEIRQEMKDRFANIDGSLRSETNTRLDTLNADLRCEIASRLSALEVEKLQSVGSVGNSVSAARLQSVEKDVRTIEAQGRKYESLVGRVQALEMNSQHSFQALEAELKRIVPSAVLPIPGRAALGAPVRGGSPLRGSSPASEGALLHSAEVVMGKPVAESPKTAPRTLGGGLDPMASAAPPHAAARRFLDESPTRGRVPHASRGQSPQASRGQSPHGMLVGGLSGAKASQPHISPRGSQFGPQRGSSFDARGASAASAAAPTQVMNDNLKESLTSLVSKVHSALAGKGKSPDIETLASAASNSTASGMTPPLAISAPTRDFAEEAANAVLEEAAADRARSQAAVLLSDVQPVRRPSQGGRRLASGFSSRARSPDSAMPISPMAGRIGPQDSNTAVLTLETECESGGDARESREVFKQALQELLQENRALQQETSQIIEQSDGYPDEQAPGWRPIGGSMHLPVGRANVGSTTQGGIGQTAFRMGGSMQLPAGGYSQSMSQMQSGTRTPVEDRPILRPRSPLQGLAPKARMMESRPRSQERRSLTERATMAHSMPVSAAQTPGGNMTPLDGQQPYGLGMMESRGRNSLGHSISEQTPMQDWQQQPQQSHHPQQSPMQAQLQQQPQQYPQQCPQPPQQYPQHQVPPQQPQQPQLPAPQQQSRPGGYFTTNQARSATPAPMQSPMQVQQSPPQASLGGVFFRMFGGGQTNATAQGMQPPQGQFYH